MIPIRRCLKKIRLGFRDFFFPPICWICFSPLEDLDYRSHVLGNLFCSPCSSRVVLADGAVCPICGQLGLETALFCTRCLGLPQSFRRAAVGAAYQGGVRDLLLRLKFRGQKEAAWPLACLAAYGAYRAIGQGSVDCVFAIPLHKSRLRERGYNQAELIGKHVARIIGAPLLKGLVRRNKNTLAQGMGGGGSRQENVRDAFLPIPNSSLLGRDVLLVDDVISTGATMNACAQTLLDGGARSVVGAAAAT